MEKLLIAVMGVSAAWKNTLINKLLEKYPDEFALVLSDKTRDLRPGEIDWEDYHKKTITEFEEWISAWLYAERNQYGNQYWWSEYYWTQKIQIAQALQDKNGLKEMEPNGYWVLISNPLFPVAWVFIDIPNEIIKKRAQERWWLSEIEIEHRILQANRDREQINEFKNIELINWNNELTQVFYHFESILRSLL